MSDNGSLANVDVDETVPHQLANGHDDSRQRAESGDNDFPAWTEVLKTKKESEVDQRIHDLEAEMARIRRQIDSLKSDVEDSSWLKALVCAEGAAFRSAVATALKTLGYKVTPGPRGHADLIAWDGNVVLVLRADGTKSNAKNRDMVQCMTWSGEATVAQLTPDDERSDLLRDYVSIMRQLGVPVTDAADADDQMVRCRGVLIVNTFRESPLDERPIARPEIPDFTSPQLIADHALFALTGLQLMCMALEAGDNERAARDVRARFASQSGVLEGYTDWQDAIHR